MSSDDAKAAVAAAKSSAREAKEEAGQQAASASSQLSDQASSAASAIKDAASDLVGRARDGAQSLSDSLPGSASDALEAGQRVLAQGGGQLGRQVAKQPIEALLLAGAIGYLVGWATSRC